MITKIKTNNLTNSSITDRDSNKKPPQNPHFKGPLEVATAAIQACEANPMLNVTVLDLTTAIVPRTVVEAETNPYAGFEAFRRESSGLIINCLIPGFIVAGAAKLIGEKTMQGKTGLSNCWANKDTINLVAHYWKKAEGKTDKEKVQSVIDNILKDTKGIDGKNTVEFKNFKFDDSIDTISKSVFENVDKKVFKNAISDIIDKTQVAENIKIAGHIDPKTGKVIDEYFSQSISDVLTHAPKILKELVGGKNIDIAKFAENAKNLVTRKSVMGLGVIIPLALSAQPINRWITEKTSGKKGAPIYKDFTQTESQELSAKEKAALIKQKVISVASIVGVALLSIGKKPSLEMLSKLAEFKGIFPSMDQARLISTTTFASRMMSSQDKNDLREATFRDIATFSAFYFLGDYVAKGIATGIQKFKGTQLLNYKAQLKDGANTWDRIKHWTKDTALKSSSELLTKEGKQMRALCQIGNIAFSLAMLGLVIPRMYRKKTDQEREKQLKEMGLDKAAINKYYPAFAMNANDKNIKTAYSAFATAKPQQP